MGKLDRKIGLAILAIIVFLILWPEVREGTSSPCQAIANKIARRASPGNELGAALVAGLGPALIEAHYAHEYPGYPVALICLARYYQQ